MKRPSGAAVRSTETAPADTRLLAIAAHQLKEHGPRHVTVVGIADAAGMTHANVYRYFASKAALIDAVAGQWLRRMEATIADIADSPDPADDKLERLIQAWARIHRDLLKEDRHLFDVYCTATETARPLIRKHRSRMRVLIDRVLDEGITTGKFDPRDREKAHSFVTDSVYRFINPLTVRLDAEVPQTILDQRLATMIRVVLRALANGSV
ncbi:TetR/AcrR family transcriptional regulator [Microvirga terrae]|uniref:TetR/AcrR family transcriptional regulator n=1 Tax=Microvirga terrae TaxID=2740529 RepID=A0ABY5RRX9_9HYPH|nr:MULTISPECIES: TetR/AcrR family transcriptional regulator [Microvirga]MBQ0824160.1 TetR/AcrR family transcriptional regulator [Microvirga sp. HBU67558]UVF20011.1 TetR/AcrR family transcriptional regulator [Microvirga terrae]